jgi:uncharacterized membrane protein YphA (DoxX/SURF4 family)
MLAAGSAVQIVAGFLLAVGIAWSVAAGALIVFTLATNLILLRFWARVEPERQVLRNAFLINIAVIGGLLLAGSRRLAADFRNEVLRKPLFCHPLDRRRANPHSARNRD